MPSSALFTADSLLLEPIEVCSENVKKYEEDELK